MSLQWGPHGTSHFNNTSGVPGSVLSASPPGCMTSSASFDFQASLADPRTYEREIEHLHKKHLLSRRLYEMRQEGVSLASLVMRRSRVARLIARAVANGSYRFEPATIRTIRADDKVREVFALELSDLIVHGAVARLIDRRMSPQLSDDLYSYRKGVSWWTAISRFSAWVRQHVNARPDPKDRGLYVLRRDIDSYTDSIPVTSGAKVWPMLSTVLAPNGRSLTEAQWKVVKNVVRPEFFTPEGAQAHLIRGVPTGLPISCVLFNLYLSEFDHELDSIPGSFYARYSDDILFAHPDVDLVREVDDRIRRLLSELGLRANEEKSRTHYLTGPGRPSHSWDEAKGTSRVTFLGMAITGDGTVGLGRKKKRRLLRDLKRRACRTTATLRSRDQDELGRTVCGVLNQAIECGIPAVQPRSAPLVLRMVTDRQQLRQLDYSIARIAVRAVSGDSGVRAFRKIPYRKLREEWGLTSLLHTRNTES